MTTTFEHPGNGYRVQVSDGACFVWTLLFGAFFFLVRGNVRHFFLGIILGCCTFGLSWLIYPFFAGGILRTMYFERGYQEIPASTSSDSLAPVFLLLIIAALAIAVWCYQFRDASSSDSKPSASVVPEASDPVGVRKFASVAEAQKEAIRRFPDLGIAGSKLNIAFVARYKSYKQQRPEYFKDTAWPIRLAEEIAQMPQTR